MKLTKGSGSRRMSHRSGDAGRGGGRGPAAAGRREVGQPRVRRPLTAGAAGITEGKFDRVAGDDMLIVTGPLRLQVLRRQRPGEPGPARHVHAAGARRHGRRQAAGYWQDEDMELDTKRNLIIGALDPRHNDPTRPSAPLDDDADRPRPGLPSGFFVDLLRRPGQPAPDRRLRLAARGPHGELHPGLQVHLDRRPGAALRPVQPRPVQRRRPPAVHQHVQQSRENLTGSATAGRSGSPTSRNPAKPEVSDQPIDLWRNDGFTDYSHDVDEDEQGIAWVSGRGGIRGYATSGRHRDPYQNRYRAGHAVRPDPRRRRRRGVGRPGVAGRRRHRAAHDADAQLRPPDRRHGTRGRRQDRQRARRAPRRTSPTPDGCIDSGRIVAVGHHGLAAAASAPRSRRRTTSTG